MTQLSLHFLGTGGSWPSVQRNVSAIALKRGSEILLFDCGEGTQRQFQRSQLSYMQVSAVFITHFHGDHFLGLPGLIQTFQLNDRKNPLHIYGPKGMNQLVDQLLHLGYFSPAYAVISHEVEDGDTLAFNGFSIKVLAVQHNVPAIAYCYEEEARPGKFNKPKALKLGVPEGPLFSRLQHGKSVTLDNGTKITPKQVMGAERPGRKVVISGDTSPVETMVEFAQCADVLVHEATFLSEMGETANDYGHSTARQAAELAKKAQVSRLYITHISPRYVDPKPIEHEAQEIFSKSYVPNDFDAVDIRLKKEAGAIHS